MATKRGSSKAAGAGKAGASAKKSATSAAKKRAKIAKKPAKPAKTARASKAKKAPVAAEASAPEAVVAQTTDLPAKSVSGVLPTVGPYGLPPSPDTAEDGAVLLEDWTPMGQCLDWRAGLQTWAWQGDQLFDEQRVPNLAHDSGVLSRRHAGLLAAWCADRAAAAALPEVINVVELGMGTGLHLRFFLDAFAKLSADGGHDWYDRLAVYATDVSRGVLEKARDRKLFAAHADCVHIGFMSAFEPGRFRALPVKSDGRGGDGAGGDAKGDDEAGEIVDLRGQLHAVFANYVLDLMPMDLFRRSRDGAEPRWQAVLARTWLAQPERIGVYVDLDVATLRQAIAAGDFRALIELFPLTEVELRTFPVDLSNHPDLAALERLADAIEAELGPEHELLREGTVASHSGGALHVSARMARALAEDGFACVRDVGLTTADQAAVPRTYSHYGPTAASGVNMMELDDWFAHGGDGQEPAVRCTAPERDGPRHQASRLLTRTHLPAVEAAFAASLGADSFATLEELVQRARAETDAAKALELFRQAMQGEPDNWVLMTEAAKRALMGGLEPRLALVLARRAASLNPETSADVWLTYGDAAWATGDLPSARQAYVYALDVNPHSAAAHYGLAYVDADRGRFESAFSHLGEALAYDPDGALRERVLQLLDICLRGQQRLRAEETGRLARRARR